MYCVCWVLLLPMFVACMRVDVVYYRGFGSSLDLLLARVTVAGFLSWLVSMDSLEVCHMWDIIRAISFVCYECFRGIQPFLEIFKVSSLLSSLYRIWNDRILLIPYHARRCHALDFSNQVMVPNECYKNFVDTSAP